MDTEVATKTTVKRRLPIGAEPFAGGTSFRVWAPAAGAVEAVVDGRGSFSMEHEAAGYHGVFVPGVRAGERYRFRLDGGDAFADPASRSQPDGPHGASQVVDPHAFRWTDTAWRGPAPEGQVLYELHVGTFTPEGTHAAAAAHLPYLKELGITCIELMPVNEFNGPFGWGYDGVNLFAPTRLYGSPDELRAFVDRAHALGLAVILDVVYNHFGPSGNYLSRFSPHYTTRRHENEWGEAIDFDGPHSAAVREFFASNAAYWIDEFHLDGLRLDATQSILDTSEEYMVALLARRARAAAGGRRILLTGENEPQHARLVRRDGLDALWNDDFHHSAVAAVTGQCVAYYSETRGTPQELVSAAKWGFLYQGQWYAWQKQRRGTPAFDLPARAFITFLQNHDQVANSARGLRLHELTSPARLRAITAFWLLAPGTPLLFQGQEWAASAPFTYFACHEDELNALVRKGRTGFLRQFPNLATAEGEALLDEPCLPATFERCKLDHAQRTQPRHAQVLTLHRELLALRRDDAVFAALDKDRLHGAVLGPEALALRWFGRDGNDRLVVLNLGATLPLLPAPEPLLAPPAGCRWRTLWHSERPRYGGSGMHEPDTEAPWRLPGQALAVLAPQPWSEPEE